MRTNPNKVFVSVYKSDLTVEQNHANHVKASGLLTLEGISFQVVKGVYKGEAELTFLLSNTDFTKHIANVLMAFNLGMLFNQESILEVSNDGRATLKYIDGESKDIGELKEVSETEALASDAYTLEPVSKRYFKVV